MVMPVPSVEQVRMDQGHLSELYCAAWLESWTAGKDNESVVAEKLADAKRHQQLHSLGKLCFLFGPTVHGGELFLSKKNPLGVRDSFERFKMK